MNKLIRNAAVASAGLVAALALVTTAWGHAHMDTSVPAKGSVVQTSPAKVEITFVEEIQKTAGTYGLTVEKDGGASVTTGAPTIDPANAAKLSVALQANLAAGRYVVNWNNVSADDGDPAEGAFSFYVKTQPTTADLAKDQDLEMVGQEPMETPTAMPAAPTVIAPAPATTPAAAASPAAVAPSASLPRTGDGSSRAGDNRWMFLIVAMAGGVAVLGAAAGISMRRGR